MRINSRRFVLGSLRWTAAGIVGFVIVFPMFWIFISSITPGHLLFVKPISYLPREPSLDNYLFLLQNVGLLQKVYNTLVIIAFTLVISTTVCLMAGYAFARFRSRGLSIAFAFVLFTVLIPPVVRARPLFDFMRFIGLYDTFPGLILIYTSSILPFTMFMIRNFVLDIPVSIEEAAELDGANFPQKLFFLVLPLLRPAVATVFIINFIHCLNDFFTPLFYSNGIQVLTLAIVQLPFRGDMYTVPWDLVSAMGCIIILPIILFVGIFQRQIMSGIMAGGVKQ
jgi:multiple sugar transport system permease protein